MDSEKECLLDPGVKSSLIDALKVEQDCRTKRRIFASLTKNRDFRRVYYRGKYLGGKYIILYYLERRYENETRLGVSASKKVGCAVKRNRVRRIIKEAFSLSLLNVNGDVVVVAKSAAVNAKMQDIMREMVYLFNKILKLNSFVKKYHVPCCVYKKK